MSTPGGGGTEAEATAAPWERLRLAREALQLSQQDVAKRIRIDVDKVAALEAGEIAKVGAPVFAAGYIRAYARIVGLSADELIAQFEGLAQLHASSATLASASGDDGLDRLSTGLPTAFSRGNGRRRGRSLRLIGAGLLIAALVAALLWVMKGGNLSLSGTPPASVVTKPLPQQGGMSAPVEESPQAVSREEIPLQQTLPAESVEPARRVLAIPAPTEYAPAPEGREKEPAPPVDETASPEDMSAVEGMNELALYFREDSWVEVRDARGERLMHRLARAGQSQTLHGVAPFAVVLGYVPGVTILLDGEAVDLGKYQGRRLARFSVGTETANEN